MTLFSSRLFLLADKESTPSHSKCSVARKNVHIEASCEFPSWFWRKCCGSCCWIWESWNQVRYCFPCRIGSQSSWTHCWCCNCHCCAGTRKNSKTHFRASGRESNPSPIPWPWLWRWDGTLPKYPERVNRRCSPWGHEDAGRAGSATS